MKIDVSVKKLFTDINDELNKLYIDNFLQKDEYFEFLYESKLSEIKLILKQLGLPVSGKKKILIKKIIDNTTPEQRKEFCSNLYYSLTDKGKFIDEQYIENKKNIIQNLKKTMIQMISDENFYESVFKMGEVYASFPIPPGIGTDWSNSEILTHITKTVLDQVSDLDFSDLSNSETYKRSLRKIMFFENIIEHNLYQTISDFEHLLNEPLKCSDLENYLLINNMVLSERDKIFIYLDTKRYNIFQLNMRKNGMKQNYRLLSNGEFKVSDYLKNKS